MPTTQTRISENTHKTLVRLAEETGKSHQEVLDLAVRRLERDLFLDRMNAGFEALRADAGAWRQEMEERAAWDVTLSDEVEP